MNVSFAMCIPFAALLLCIALGPILFSEWWEKHQPLVVILCSLAFIIPFAIANGGKASAETVLDCIFNDYLTFIVLLFGLFCVSGNISLDGEMAGAPRTNVIVLLIGTILASWIGTTGASMLMIRPILKMNSWRQKRAHIMIFFIFLVSNMGGCLTPIGDPPLLMGFSRGVPFFWSMHLLPILIVNLIIMLIVFYRIDTKYYRQDIVSGAKPDIRVPGNKLKVLGVHNLIYIGMIVMAVILSGILPTLSFFQDANGVPYKIPIFGEVEFPLASLIECAIILLAAFLSFKTTNVSVRKKNHFTWGSIQEVAILFVGIFITMQPALMILKNMGGSLGLNQPFQMFWVTGALSSFLDNTPTYLVFLTTAGALNFTSGIVTTIGTVPMKMLMAISAGAVFMGANTYIGNAPNFMVKSISEENGVKMPSFFGYMWWSVRFLIPVFVLDTILFFLGGIS